MGYDNKTSCFIDAIEKHAEKQRNNLKNEIDKLETEEYNKANEKGIKDAYSIVKEELSVKKSKIVSKYSKEKLESKNKLFAKRIEIINDIENEVKNRILKFVDSDKYNEYLINSLKEVSSFLNEKSCIIYISSKDSDKKPLILSEINNAEIEIDNNIQLGGFISSCKDLSIMIDETLDTRLKDEINSFIETSNIKVVYHE